MAGQPILAVLGATGTGKSALAIELARAFNGEVISVDAYQVFRGLDIGTAKVALAERLGVAHHLIDIADPDEPTSLAVFLRHARDAIADVRARQRLPVLAGGSGQHMWALLEGWQVPRVPPDLELRKDLEDMAVREGSAALLARLREVAPERAASIDPANHRRLVRAIEVASAGCGSPAVARRKDAAPQPPSLIIGLQRDRASLYQSLDERVDAMLRQGFIEEIESLRAGGYGDSPPVRTAAGYRQISDFLDGDLDYGEAVQRAKNAHHRLARKQAGWFREEDGRIKWIASGPEAAASAAQLVTRWLGDALNGAP